MSTNPSRYERLRGFLGGDDAGLSENAELGLLSLELVGQTAQFNLVARADDDAGLVTFLVEAPFACPADRRPDLTSLLERANLELSAGAWVHDVIDGAFGFRMAAMIEPEEMTQERLSHLLFYTCASLERALPAVHALCQGELTPQDALPRMHDRLEVL